jgi:hypothetical protein
MKPTLLIVGASTGLVILITGIAISVFLLVRALYYGPAFSPPFLQEALLSFIIPLTGLIALAVCRSLAKRDI